MSWLTDLAVVRDAQTKSGEGFILPEKWSSTLLQFLFLEDLISETQQVPNGLRYCQCCL